MSSASSLQAVRDSLTADRTALQRAVERVPPEMRGRKPAPDRWSVAEVLEHLSIVESRVVAMLGAMLPTAPISPADSAPAAPIALDRTRLRNRAERVTAPEQIRPTGLITADQAWSALERSRQQLLGLLDAARERDLAQINRVHPVLGPLNGYQWIAAIGGHEERHAAQIEEIFHNLAI
jgi:hypothetical protein